MNSSLTVRQTLLALAVVAIWGTNFVVIKVALAHLPPLLFATLRFALAALPLVFLLRRPQVPWRNLAAYGLAIGAGQFGLLFFAMTRYISPGMASLVVQAQVFFTVGLVMWISGERLRRYQVLAGVLALAGIGVIASHTDGQTTVLGLMLTLAAAMCWALGNVTGRAAGRVDALAYVAWSSLFAVPPLLVFSLALEGWPAIVDGLQQADAWTWAAVVWQSVGNTIFGYGVWAWLLTRHPAATVAPFALLVPIFGMGAATLFLDEPLQGWKLLAGALVIGGLTLNLLWPRLMSRR